jgi:hypothetical protein
MGTTLTALQSGNTSIQWVAVIEGFEYLLTDGDPAAALTAWAGLEWSQAASGLAVAGDWSQRLDPWEAFTAMGSMRLSLQPDAANDIAAAFFRDAPVLTDVYLAADLTASAGTITVPSTSGFTSPIYIGNERITYSGTTATTFTGCTRGRMHPFSTQGGTPNRFGTQHRATTSPTTVSIPPIVSGTPRRWIGKWVGLWAHRVAGGVLDTKAEAQLVFAGRIVSITDDESGCAVIECKHVAEVVKDTVIGRDTWRAQVAEGVQLVAGDRFIYRDRYGAAGWSNATALSCVVGASGPNQVAPGRYTVTEIASRVNEWLAAERAATRILGNVELSGPIAFSDGTYRMSITCAHSAAAATQASYFQIGMPPTLLDALGWTSTDAFDGLDSITIEATITGAETTTRYGNFAPLRWQLYGRIWNYGLLDLTDEVGTFEGQTSWLPPRLRDWANAQGGGDNWGIFRIYGQFFLGEYAGGVLSNVVATGYGSSVDALAPGFRWGEGTDKLEVTQAFVISGAPSDVLVWLLASTDGTGYNHPTYDILPSPLSAGIPWSLLGDAFVGDAQAMDVGPGNLDIFIEKPTKMVELIGHDLIVRRLNFGWKNGTLRLTSWATPNGSTSLHALTEANKATPVGTVDANRSPTRIDSTEQGCTIKLEYNRRNVTSDEYRDDITLLDRAAIDDAGGDDRPVTIQLRNTIATVGEGATADEIDPIAANFLATLPLFSRPMRLVTRTIALPYFEGMAPGDTVTLSDSFARNPDTGLRGIVGRKALVIAHRFDFGGAQPGDGSIAAMYGEATLMLLADDRTFQYAPAAQVDHTVTGGGFTGGYNDGTLTLRFLPNEHSVAPSTDLASFTAGDKVRIIELDPATPGAELTWARTITSVAGADVVLSSSIITGFDPTKRYRMVPDDYVTSTTFQTRAYQADAADSLIVNVARAHHYGAGGIPIRDLPTDADLPERHAALDVGDGKPYTSATDRALARGLNNLRRCKTRHSSAGFFESPVTAAPTGASDWDLLGVRLIRLRPNLGAATRSLEISPFYRSATGAAVTLRVTVCRARPRPETEADPDNNYQFAAPFQQATWTTSSTTYQVGAAATFSVGLADADGLAWVVIEGTANAQTYGLARCSETIGGDVLPDMAWCKNSDAPHAGFITRLLGRLLESERKDTKELFSAAGSASWQTGALASRTRWHHEFRTGTGVSRIAIVFVVAPPTAKTSTSSCTYSLTNVVAATTTTASVKTGAADSAAAAVVPLGDCFIGVKYLDVAPSTRYQAKFDEVGHCRLVAAVVYELPATTPAAYPVLSASSPIYAAHRTRLLGGVTDALNNNGSVLFNWQAELPTSAPRSSTSTTARNIVDDTSTTVSASTPGFIPPLANARTLMQAGTAVVMSVYGTPPSSGNGVVTLKDSSGTVLITVTLTAGGGAGWYTASGVLPATDGLKYDVHFGRATVGAQPVTVGAVSIYQYG